MRFEKITEKRSYKNSGAGFVESDREMAYPRLCAHRGFSTIAPENSMPAFGAAVAMGAEEIELDLWPTADGEIVSCHDGTLDRVSTGSGRLSEIAVFCVFLQVFPTAIFEHLYIFGMVCQANFVVIELIHNVLRLALFKVIHAEAAYLRKFPALVVSAAQICLFFLMVEDRKISELFFSLHLQDPPLLFCKVFGCA